MCIGFEGHFQLRYLAPWSVGGALAGCGSWQGIESALRRIAEFCCCVQAVWQLRGTLERPPGHPRYHTPAPRHQYNHVNNQIIITKDNKNCTCTMSMYIIYISPRWNQGTNPKLTDRPLHSPQSRKSSYARRATEASDLLDLENEEWYKGAQKLQFNE